MKKKIKFQRSKIYDRFNFSSCTIYKGIKEEGYDRVATRRITGKGESKVRSFLEKCFIK